MKQPTTNRDYRAPFHDYHSRQIYLITIKTLKGAPTLSNIREDNHIEAEPTPAGQCVREAFNEVFGKNPSFSIIEHCIMPDHAHYIIFVKERTERSLGEYIGWAKSKATSLMRKLLQSSEANYFTKGYNDRILSSAGQLKRMIDYVKDNPRRLLLRRANPDFFNQCQTLEIAGMKFSACGNIFLLNEVEIESVVIHRAWSTEELEAAKSRWNRCTQNGGILISPFISKAEKEVFTDAMAQGGRAIVLTTDLITERYKPSGQYFDLCAQGRLLMLHPVGMAGRSYGGITRSEALAMNRAAEVIANQARR